MSLKNGRDRRPRHAQLRGDLPGHQTTSTQPQNHLLTFGRRPVGDRLGPRAPGLKPGQAFGPKPTPPLEPRADRHTESARLIAIPGPRSYVVDDGRSTIGAGSGITVDVHLGLLLGSALCLSNARLNR